MRESDMHTPGRHSLITSFSHARLVEWCRLYDIVARGKRAQNVSHRAPAFWLRTQTRCNDQRKRACSGEQRQKEETQNEQPLRPEHGCCRTSSELTSFSFASRPSSTTRSCAICFATICCWCRTPSGQFVAERRETIMTLLCTAIYGVVSISHLV